MELLLSMLLFMVLAATPLAMLLSFCRRGRRTTQWPPGPPALPIIGHLHLLGQLPHQSLYELSRTYGPLMGLRLGGVPTIVASTAEMAKEILQTHDALFARHPRTAASEHTILGTDMVATPGGSPTFRWMRQICNLGVFSGKRIASFKHVREEEIRSLVRAVLKAGRQGEEKVVLRSLLQATTNNIICRIVMGKKMADVSSDEHQGELLSLVEEIHYFLGIFYVGDFIPWLSWLDPRGHLKRMKAVGCRAQALLQEIIDVRRLQQQEQRNCSDVEDFLDVLLTASNEHKLSDDNVKGLILDMLTGGTHTIASVVEWTLAELINNPKEMHKVQQDLNKVVGNARFVKEADLDNLPYLEMVIKETIRLHPIAPLLLPHETHQECQIKGYKVPAHTRAYINVWAAGRDGSTWETPLEFLPERYERKELDAQGLSCEILAFSLGRRGCPGRDFGLLTAQMMVATLIHGFTWTMDHPSSKEFGSYNQFVDMSERFGLVLDMATPLSPFSTPRLPLCIY